MPRFSERQKLIAMRVSVGMQKKDCKLQSKGPKKQAKAVFKQPGVVSNKKTSMIPAQMLNDLTKKEDVEAAKDKEAKKKERKAKINAALNKIADFFDQCLLDKWKRIHPFEDPPTDLLVWKSFERM
jgi:hypothetical protein